MRARMLLAAVSFLALPAPAGALAPHQAVVTSAGYAPSEVTILRGDNLTLNNADPTDSHDLVSLDRGPGGVLLFGSGVTGPGDRGQVSGVSALAPSVYPFYCTVHEWMTGNLTVLG